MWCNSTNILFLSSKYALVFLWYFCSVSCITLLCICVIMYSCVTRIQIFSFCSSLYEISPLLPGQLAQGCGWSRESPQCWDRWCEYLWVAPKKRKKKKISFIQNSHTSYLGRTNYKKTDLPLLVELTSDIAIFAEYFEYPDVTIVFSGKKMFRSCFSVHNPTES